jgi:hypothetical protein
VQNTFTTPWWAIYQGNSFGQSGGFTGTGDFSAAVQQSGNQSSDNAYRWVSGHLPIYECFLSWGSTSVSAEAKLKGQLYDAVIINGFWTGESSVSLDGHTWMTITHGPIGGVTGTQCLFLAIT